MRRGGGGVIDPAADKGVAARQTLCVHSIPSERDVRLALPFPRNALAAHVKQHNTTTRTPLIGPEYCCADTPTWTMTPPPTIQSRPAPKMVMIAI